ncbi:hypothetical protein MMPV_001599 [Pyropia vietnamensis]
MATATWKGVVIARTDKFETVEGNVYFPLDSLIAAHFTPSSHTSMCPWKGTATYKNITVDGETNANAAWVYEAPKAAAANIKGHVAFWKGVQVNRL